METSPTNVLNAPLRQHTLSSTIDRPENFFNVTPSAQLLVKKTKQAELIAELAKIKQKRQGRENDLRFLSFAIGLAIALGSVVIIINWKFYDETNKVELNGSVNELFEDLMEIPLTEQVPPPPPQQAQQFILKEVGDEIEVQHLELNLDVEITEEMSVTATLPIEIEDLPDEEADEVFVIVENKPEPVGGFAVFYKYLGDNLKYPPAARIHGISGRVYVEFVVAKDGSITNLSVIKGIGSGCDEEALRVMASAPPWNPGKQRGRPVKVKMTIPINFTLHKS